MRRYLSEILVGLAVSVVVVLGTVALGSAASRETGAAVQLPMVTMPGCLDAPVIQLDQSGIVGAAALCITDDAMRPALRVANLTQDTVYLVLFEYFERSAACQSRPCGSADLRADGSGGVLARMDATVANGTRRADFLGDFRDLPFSRRSQVTLTLFDRGPVRGSDVQRRAYLLLALPAYPLGDSPGEKDRHHGIGRQVAQALFLPPAEDLP